MVSTDDAAGEGTADTGAVVDHRPQPGRHRVGVRPLTVLAAALNAMILRALAEGPMKLADLRRATGLPAQTTLRGHLASLIEFGALRKRPGSEMPFAVENSLTPMGSELLGLANSLEGWLARAPDGPIPLESSGAKGVIKALIDGWGSTILQTLASQPISLTELDRGIDTLSYPSIERRLSSLRLAGLVEALPNSSAGTPYTLTDWGRRSAAPLVVAGRCETRHMQGEAAPVKRADIEAAFMMAVPLIGLPPTVNGSCRIEVKAAEDGAFEDAELTVAIDAGRVVSCEVGASPKVVARAAGPAESWYAAVAAGDPRTLRLGQGGKKLAEQIVAGLHSVWSPPER